MKRFLILFFFLQILGVASASAEEKNCPTCTPTNLIYAAKTAMEQALNSGTSKEEGSFAKKGLAWAETCVKKFPEETGCYYYRALNMGLYLESSPSHYQKKLKKMISDSEVVIQHNPNYDNGGAYRLLGNIFLKVPSFALVRDPVVKDIDKALTYSQQALAINKQDHDNRQLMGEILFEQEKFSEALTYLKPLQQEYTQTSNLSVNESKNLKTISKLIEKAEKKLTKKNQR